MNFIGNAFSLQMLTEHLATVNVEMVLREDIPFNECESVIGHQDLADHLGVPMDRRTLKLSTGDVLYVAQFVGGRLPEGTSMLDADQMGLIIFYKVTVLYYPQCLPKPNPKIYY
jgi:hypothetical protein